MLPLRPFELSTPTTVEEAVSALAVEGAELLAGGTDLLPNLKHGLSRPAALVRLGGVRELHGIEHDGAAGGLSLGAMETLARVAAHSAVRERFPSLAEAASHAASPLVRHTATVGGNLNLQPRCRYVNQTEFWRDALGGCLKCGGSVCHVVPSGRRCVAAMSSDLTPVLISLDAVIELAGPGGRRVLPLADYYRSDGVANTVREKSELVTRVRIPYAIGPRRVAYARWSVRGSIDFPLVSAALRLDVSGDDADATLTRAVVVVGALTARPKSVARLDALAGRRLDDPSLAADLAERVFDDCKTVENLPYDAPYRRHMLKVQTRRAVERLLAPPTVSALRETPGCAP